MSLPDQEPAHGTRDFPLCVAVLGPTCSGKSAVALQIAQTLGTALISCDSMQIYKGMDIGTASPSPAQMATVPHFLVNELDIHERFDAYRFVCRARTILNQFAVKYPGRPVVLAGGTGLYAKALIYDFEMQPSAPEVYRQVVREYADGAGEARLRAELAAKLPNLSAGTLRNPRRLLRAVEIHRLGGNPNPERRPSPHDKQCRPLGNFYQYVILPAPSEHECAIRKRTNYMLRNGWIEETERLLQQGLLECPTARQALGYPEVASYIRGEIMDPETLFEQVVTRTRQYARRQRTWFRRQHPGAKLLPLRKNLDTDTVASAILADGTPLTKPI